ncbi:MAG: LysE family transporter [Bacteroidales bacterium]|nr:LysE family transporter [Candidatus Cacconaster equi]
MVENFIKAILIGLGASIPLGPLGIMCIQRTLSKGRASGFSVGLGSSLGDTIYAAIALLSLAFVSDFLDRNRVWVMIIGGIIVVLIGLQIAIKNPIKDIKNPSDKVRNTSKHFQDAATGFLMTLSNPGALVLMLGLFAFFGLDLGEDYQIYSVLVVLAGIFIGTAGWWFVLSWAVNLFRKRFRLRQLIIANRIAGLVIAAIGFASIAEGLFNLLFMK